MDTSSFDTKILTVDDLMLLQVGVNQYVPLVVRRARASQLVYDPVLQSALVGPQVAVNMTPSASQSSAFQDNVQFGLNATVTSISNVNDIFWNLSPLEIYQVFVGVAPRQERFWIKQPYNQFETGLEQSITPSSTYPDVGFFDGFRSPYTRPHYSTETIILVSVSINFTLFNAAPWVVSPRFNFFINRCYVEPVTDPAVVKALLNHSIHARYITMGSPTLGIPWPKSQYDGVDPLPVAVGSYPVQVAPNAPSNEKSVYRAMAVAGYYGSAVAQTARNTSKWSL